MKKLLALLAFSLPISLSAQSEKSPLLVETPGLAINLEPFILKELPTIDYEKVILPGPQFIFSDEPETIRQPTGVALRESIKPGTVRLYLYNVNGNPGMDRKINAVIKNTGDKPMTVHFLRYATHQPTGNYHGIAKNCLTAFLKGEATTDDLIIEPGESVPLDAELEKKISKHNDLAHGIYEFLVDQPGEVSVVIGDPEKSSAEISESLTEIIPVQRQKNAGRGLFGVSNYRITNPDDRLSTTDGPRQLIVADNVSDPWVVGIDGSTGDAVELRGNYGILYETTLEYETPDGKGLALVTWNSRYESSQWCGGMVTALDIRTGHFPPQVVSVPSNQLVLRVPPECGVIQLYPPVPEGEIGIIDLTYSPTGASCLPIPLIFIPIDWPEQE